MTARIVALALAALLAAPPAPARRWAAVVVREGGHELSVVDDAGAEVASVRIPTCTAGLAPALASHRGFGGVAGGAAQAADDSVVQRLRQAGFLVYPVTSAQRVEWLRAAKLDAGRPPTARRLADGLRRHHARLKALGPTRAASGPRAPLPEEVELREAETRLEALRDRRRRYQIEMDAAADLVRRLPQAVGAERSDARLVVTRSEDSHGRTVYSFDVARTRLRALLEEIAGEAGLDLVLDDDVPYRDKCHLVTVDLDGATLREALDLLLGRFDLGYSIGEASLVVVPAHKEPFAAAEERLRHKAQLAYGVALAKFPDHPAAPEAHLTLGRYFFGCGLYPQAIQQLERLRRDYHRDARVPEALFTLAKALMAIDDRARARATYATLADRYGSHPLAADALLALANDSLQNARPADALQSLNDLLTRHRGSNSVLPAKVALAKAHLQAGRLGDALDTLEELLATDLPEPEERVARLLAAKTLLAQGQLDRAREAFRTLVAKSRRSPEGQEASFLFADTLFRQKHHLAAIQALQAFIADAPASPWAQQATMRLGDVYGAIALHDRAIATYEGLLTDHPNTPLRPSVLLALGQCYADKGNYQKAQHHFQRAAQDTRDPAAWRARLRAAQAALADGRPADALPLLEGVTTKARDPELLARAYHTLGDCHRRLGRLHDAIAAYVRATQANPERPSAELQPPAAAPAPKTGAEPTHSAGGPAARPAAGASGGTPEGGPTE